MASGKSRFWGAESDSSSSNSSDSSDSDSDDEKAPTAGKSASAGRVWAIESDSDSDDQQREVVSKKDKVFIELDFMIQKTKNHIKINDWSGIQADWADMVRYQNFNPTMPSPLERRACQLRVGGSGGIAPAQPPTRNV